MQRLPSDNGKYICTWYQVLKLMVATDSGVRVSAGDVFARRRLFSEMRFLGVWSLGHVFSGLSLFICAAMRREGLVGDVVLSRRMNRVEVRAAAKRLSQQGSSW